MNRKAMPVPVTVLAYAPERRYRPRDFEPHLLALDQLVSRPPALTPVTLPKALPAVDIDALRVSDRIKDVIVLGDDPDRLRYPSRSEAVFAVTVALAVADYDDATIAAVLLDRDHGISQKPQDKGLAWVGQEIARARAKIKALDASRQRVLPRIESVRPFPLQVFPAPLARYVKDVADSMPAPTDFAGIFGLGVASAAIGTSRELEIKPGWREAPSAYLGAVGETGDKKSPTLKRVCQPLYARQEVLYTRYQQALADYERALEQYTVQLRLWHQSLRRSKTTRPRLPMPQKPRRPLLRQLLTTDTTREAVPDLLRDNPRGLLIVRDELTGRRGASLFDSDGGVAPQRLRRADRCRGAGRWLCAAPAVHLCASRRRDVERGHGVAAGGCRLDQGHR